MNSLFEDLKTVGILSERDLVSTREITWKIRNFESLPEEDYYSLNSPTFDFQSATWCLRLYPHFKGTHISLRLMRLCSRVPHHAISCNMTWPDKYYGYHSEYCALVKEDNETGATYFIKRSLLPNSSSCVGGTESLTLMCQISCYRSLIASVFSQTEQDRKMADAEGLSQSFKNLLLNGQGHDLVLKVKDKEFRAHRNILRARSTVFDTMLSYDMIEKSTGLIDIPDCDPEAFEQFLLYLYTGKTKTLDAGNMLSLYYIADKYDVGHLKEQCRRVVKTEMASTNVSDVIELASKHNDAVLLECATDYFVQNASVVLRTVEWQSFAERHIAQADELSIKAAENLEALKNSIHETRKYGDHLEQVHLIATKEITWPIPKFKSLPKTAGYSINSQTFDFQRATWCLRMYPYFRGTYIGFTIVRLCSRVPRHRLRYNLIWPDVHHANHSVEDVFDEDHKENGDMWFFDRSRFHRFATEIKNLVCQISCYGPPVADASSQTKRSAISIENLCQSFKNFLLDGQGCDVVLNVQGRKFRAHQNILRARSPILNSMLSHDNVEKNSGVIDVPDCDPGAFEQFLLYLYSGEVETLDTGNLLPLYYIGDKYNMGPLKEQCRQFIKNWLTPVCVPEVMQLALSHGDRDLLQFATDYFVKYASAVLPTAEWQTFVKHNPTQADELLIKAAGK